jgi:hypothetical protein
MASRVEKRLALQGFWVLVVQYEQMFAETTNYM